MIKDDQDDVARHLIRTPFHELHILIHQFGHTGRNKSFSWERIVSSPAIESFINSHGWTLKEYGKACRDDASSISFDYRFITAKFIKYA